MSHDSGFRRGDHATSHNLATNRSLHNKASEQLEERLRRKREQSERLRRLMDAQRYE